MLLGGERLAGIYTLEKFVRTLYEPRSYADKPLPLLLVCPVVTSPSPITIQNVSRLRYIAVLGLKQTRLQDYNLWFRELKGYQSLRSSLHCLATLLRRHYLEKVSEGQTSSTRHCSTAQSEQRFSSPGKSLQLVYQPGSVSDSALGRMRLLTSMAMTLQRLLKPEPLLTPWYTSAISLRKGQM